MEKEKRGRESNRGEYNVLGLLVELVIDGFPRAKKKGPDRLEIQCIRALGGLL